MRSMSIIALALVLVLAISVVQSLQITTIAAKAGSTGTTIQSAPVPQSGLPTTGAPIATQPTMVGGC